MKGYETMPGGMQCCVPSVTLVVFHVTLVSALEYHTLPGLHAASSA